MSRKSAVLEQMPPAVLAQLRRLGENLAVARQRRRETLKAWAQRIGVSEPTLSRMEKGDPSVAMAVYATALWIMGRDGALADVASPENDLGALEREVNWVRQRAVRRPASIERRLTEGVAKTDSDRHRK